MLNVNKLKAKMIEKGYSIKDFTKKININETTFRRKMKNNSFYVSEVEEIIRELHLSENEILNIFFV